MAVAIKGDVEIQQDVMDELDLDPDVDVSDIGVNVVDGIVTLTGTVQSFMERWAAEHAALRVPGVRAVANNVTVRPPGMAMLTDTEIARAVADSLELEVLAPIEDIDIRVSDGHVTLEGIVERDAQRRELIEVAERVRGVKAVIDLLDVIELREPEAIA